MARLKVKELQQLRKVLAILAVGLIVVCTLIVMREFRRARAMRDVGKNTIEVRIDNA